MPMPVVQITMPLLAPAVRHGLGRRLAENGVVAALLAVAAAVQDAEALGGEIGLDVLFQTVTAVIRRNGIIYYSSSTKQNGIMFLFILFHFSPFCKGFRENVRRLRCRTTIDIGQKNKKG